jgi:hypothetical protein
MQSLDGLIDNFALQILIQQQKGLANTEAGAEIYF